MNNLAENMSVVNLEDEARYFNAVLRMKKVSSASQLEIVAQAALECAELCRQEKFILAAKKLTVAVTHLGHAQESFFKTQDFFDAADPKVKEASIKYQHGYCETHKEPFQQLWSDSWLCESCFQASFHHGDEGLEE